MKFIKFFLTILVVVALQSCEDKISVEDEKVNQPVTLGLEELPDPSMDEIHGQVGSQMPTSANVKSSRLKSARSDSSGSTILVEVQRLDSGYFVSGLTRRYFIKVSGDSTELLVGYMYQTFDYLSQDGKLGPYKLSIVWGLSDSDGLSKAVTVIPSINLKGNVSLEFTSTAGISLRREVTGGGSILLPRVGFVASASFGGFGWLGNLSASQTLLNLDFALESNIESIVYVVIPSDMRAYPGKYDLSIQGTGNSHIRRSYSVAAGQKMVVISLPFTAPSSLSMEIKLLKHGKWEETGTLFYGDQLSFLYEDAGIDYYCVSELVRQ